MPASDQIGPAARQEGLSPSADVRDASTSPDDESKRPDLDEQLKALQSDAAEQYPDYRRRHELLWRLLSKTYLWWREASQEDDYLEMQYKEKGIRYRSHGDRPNFNPLIRLVWGIGDVEPADRVTISQWNQALQGMHAQYLLKPEDFNHNPEGKLTALFQLNGGVAGLAGASPGIADELGRGRARSPTKSARAGASDAGVTTEISQRALAQVNAFTEIAAFTTEQPIRVGAGNLLVLLARDDWPCSCASRSRTATLGPLVGCWCDHHRNNAVRHICPDSTCNRISVGLSAFGARGPGDLHAAAKARPGARGPA